jgi:hypothetical protein
VIGTIARDRRQLQASRPLAEPANQRIAELIRQDLANGRRIWMSDDGAGFTINGYGGLDRQTLVPDGRLARVQYRVEAGALRRRQRYLDDPLRPMPWEEIVAVSVERVLVSLPMSVDDMEPAEGEEEQAADDGGQWIGPRATLTIQYADPSRPSLSERLVVR